VQRAVAAVARQRRPAATGQRAAALGLGALGLLVLLIAAYVLLPRAVVVLHPRTQPLGTTVELRVDPAASTGDAGRVPARVGVVVVEVAEELATEGRRPAPDARAIGSVTLVNRQGGLAVVPAGTTVMTPSGARFSTLAEASLDAAAGSTARAAVRALEPGESGNVARLEISRILGPLATRLAVLNEEPTSGGGQSASPMVTAEDRARVRGVALDRARFDGTRALHAELRDGEQIVAPTLALDVLEEQYEGNLGDAVAAVRYRARARVAATVYARAELERVARAAWRPAAPSGFFVPTAAPDVGAAVPLGLDGSAVVVRVPLQTVAVAEMDANAIREAVRGRSPDQARRELGRMLPLEAEPRVRVEPPWLAQAPLRVDVALDLNPPPRA
jgi:hypothetical protein